jgi:hypothetical protein
MADQTNGKANAKFAQRIVRAVAAGAVIAVPLSALAVSTPALGLTTASASALGLGASLAIELSKDIAAQQ